MLICVYYFVVFMQLLYLLEVFVCPIGLLCWVFCECIQIVMIYCMRGIMLNMALLTLVSYVCIEMAQAQGHISPP